MIREAARRPTLTLEELQRSTAQVGESVPRTAISHALYKSGLYGRVTRREPLLKQAMQFVVGGTTNVEEGALLR